MKTARDAEQRGDIEMAIQLYSQLINTSLKAKTRLFTLLYKHKPDQKDYAIVLLKEAADGGDLRAIYNLGCFYQTGRNSELALAQFEKVIEKDLNLKNSPSIPSLRGGNHGKSANHS